MGVDRKEYQRQRRNKFREFYYRLKFKPCVDCKIQYSPWVMQFDHLDASTKRKNVSEMLRGSYTQDEIVEEANKCDVVCANCHSERTHRRRINMGL